MSGADFYWLTAQSTTKAMSRVIEEIENGKLEEKDAKIIINMNDFEQILKQIKPSVSSNEKYSLIKDVI